MTDWRDEIERALRAFDDVIALAGGEDGNVDLTLECLPAPHRPKMLPAGKMAVYCFWGCGEWLKVGKVGPNSGPRFLSQHYNSGSARSTLAGSLLKDLQSGRISGFNPDDCGSWIKANVHRCNIFMGAEKPKTLLSLLEAFLHHRLQPRYEG